jgi:uncharacterized repeat protein (TIGR03803 family)
MKSAMSYRQLIIGTVTFSALILSTVSVLLIAARPAQAQTETVLHSFTGQPDGEYPSAALVLNAKGTLYGTTDGGGAYGSSAGTVFEVTPSGIETVLYNFGAQDGDGSNPAAGLLRADGAFYGTTLTGGPNSFGTLFKVTSAGRETVLASFTDEDGGGYPEGNLIRDHAGNLYGTNSGYNGGYGNGAVFQVTPSGTLAILYKFSGGADGLCPYGGLVRDSDGNLYGTTYRGGASGEGTVFEITPDGNETVLHSFTGEPDGSLPAAGLLRDANGNLYGTTTGGGNGYGTVFKVTKTGVETVLYSFKGGADGYYPVATLVRDAKGNLYGTTVFGGTHGDGTVFKVTKTGVETVLYSFTGGADGNEPDAGVVFDKQGNLFGTTVNGGISNSHCPDGCGVVFKIVP